MHLNELIAIIETIAPTKLAMDFDNVGLLIEPEKHEIKKLLFALDCTLNVAKEAVSLGVDMVITHHPLFFRGIKRLSYKHPDTAAAMTLVRHGIGMYAAHTNLDCANGGVNDVLAKKIGLSDISYLSDAACDEPPIGRIGVLETPIILSDFAKVVGSALNTKVRYAGPTNKLIKRVALVGGTGGDMLELAQKCGADAFVTGEAKHSAALAAQVMDMGLIVAGHYETERPVLEDFISGLQEALSGLQYNVEVMIANEDSPSFRTT